MLRIIDTTDHKKRIEFNKDFEKDINRVLSQYSGNTCVKFANYKIGDKIYEKIKFLINDKEQKIQFTVERRLGQGDSMDGEAHAVCIPTFKEEDDPGYCNPYTKKNVAIKFIPLTIEESKNGPKESKKRSKKPDYGDIKLKTWMELNILYRLKKLLIDGVSPHFQYIYGHNLCNNTTPNDFDNENITNYYKNQEIITDIVNKHNEISTMVDSLVDLKIFRNYKSLLVNSMIRDDPIYRQIEFNYDKIMYSNKSLIIYNELAHYDLSLWFKYAISRSLLNCETVMSIMFQILSGINALNSVDVSHMDLHLGNILITRVKPGGYWKYSVPDKKGIDRIYYVPNMGYQVKLWDFGRAIVYDDYPSKKIGSTLIRQVQRFFGDAYGDLFISDIEESFSNPTETELKILKKLTMSFDVFRSMHSIMNVVGKCKKREGFKELHKVIDGIVSEAAIDFVEKTGKFNSRTKPNGDPISVINRVFKCYKEKKRSCCKKIPGFDSDETINDTAFIVSY